MRRHIVFSSVVCLYVRLSVSPSVSLSVRLSVCLSRFRVRSIYFERLMRFTNTFAQMSSMMSLYTVRMFDQFWFKVNVKG